MSDLENEYKQRFETVLVSLAEGLERHLKDSLQGEVRIDRISARAKSVDRFVAKAKATESASARLRAGAALR